MPSYFIGRRPRANGEHLVHDRSRCPPECFPAARDAEYLGDLLDVPQALSLARLNYLRVNGCPWCACQAHEPLTA